MRFAEATALSELGDGRFSAHLQPGWDAFGGVANGGYVLALAAKAAVVATGRQDPISVTAHYIGPGRSGSDVTISTRVVKNGRQFSVAHVDMTCADSLTISALATCGDAAEEGPLADFPDLPPPDACVPVVPGDPLPPPMVGQIETRLHPDDAAFLQRPTGRAGLRGWFRLLDGEPLSTLAAILATDTWPPPLFIAEGPTGWIATLELTVHIRSHPRTDWLACVFDRNVVSGGTVSWDGTIADERGRLVATCRQLALLPRV